jgi:hypothetical protein
LESIIRNVILVIKITMNQDNPEVPDEAIVEPQQERPETMELLPEQVNNKDEVEYEQMKSADNDMDGDDNPDLDTEA